MIPATRVLRVVRWFDQHLKRRRQGADSGTRRIGGKPNETVRGSHRDLGLIRLRGHDPKGGYDVHDVRYEAEAKPAELY